jgi:hypothetical protein
MSLRAPILAVILFLAASTQLFAEYVFLKNGEIIKCSIVADSANMVIIKDENNKQQKIPRNDIMRILYTDLKVGKIYIQKRDGKGLVAYLIDEDREKYIFRKEFNNPEEFTIMRKEVLFMADKNPSGLQPDGEPEAHIVKLKWLPPYDPVKKYNLYTKTDSKGKYDLTATAKGTTVVLKDLKSNTTYYMIITAVDSLGNESEPSNEIKISTKNIPPEKPVVVSIMKAGSGEKKIIWNPSNDPDGKVEKYRIYGSVNGKREKVAEIKPTEYDLTDAIHYEKVELVALDDRGDESEAVTIIGGNVSLDFTPGVIVPLGTFGKMFNIGYGGDLSLRQQNMFFHNLEGGVFLGFYYLPGKDLLETKNKNYKSLMFVPLYATAGYHIGIGDRFSIKPVLSLGGTYIDMNYTDRNRVDGQNRHLRIFEASFKAGVSAEYWYSDSLTILAGSEYGAVIEKSGLLSFVLINAGIGYSF